MTDMVHPDLYYAVHEQLDVLIDAVGKLYYAAHWYPDRDVNSEKLWTDLRDAAGLAAGNSPTSRWPEFEEFMKMVPLTRDNYPYVPCEDTREFHCVWNDDENCVWKYAPCHVAAGDERAWEEHKWEVDFVDPDDADRYYDGVEVIVFLKRENCDKELEKMNGR